jgi:uncharacterized CHY-type Zn-finger protein
VVGVALSRTPRSRSREYVTLSACPFCGYQFRVREPRHEHFYEEHDPDDVPALSGGEPA